MEVKEVEAYFKTLHNLDAYIDRKMDDKKFLWAFAAKANADGLSNAGEILKRIEALDAVINALIDDYADYRDEAMEYAQRLDADQCEVVCRNLINWESLVKTSEKMGVSRQWVTVLKRRAIRNLCGIIGESELFVRYSSMLGCR